VTVVKAVTNEPHTAPDCQRRNLVMTIGLPLLLVAFIGIALRAFASGMGTARMITWGQLEQNRRRYLRDLDIECESVAAAGR